MKPKPSKLLVVSLGVAAVSFGCEDRAATGNRAMTPEESRRHQDAAPTVPTATATPDAGTK